MTIPTKVEISRKTIFLIFGLAFGLWLFQQVWDILLMVFIALVLVSALSPLVDRLEAAKIPRTLAILAIYLLLWILVGGLVAGIVPGLLEQSTKLVKLLPQALNQIEFFNTHQQDISREVLSRIGSLPGDIIRFTVSLFGNLVNVITTLVMVFYLLQERRNFSSYIEKLIGDRFGNHSAADLVHKIESKLGSWVRGELTLMFSVGLATYIGLTALGVEAALPLAILAGTLEIVPNIGPIISAIPAVLVALTSGPFIVIGTIALYIFIQQLENNLLVPKIMQQAVGVNPLVSILALMIGFRLAGPVGAVLAIPFIITAQVLLDAGSSPKQV